VSLTGLVQLWQILTSSSYTNSTQRRLGASRSLIWGLTKRSNAADYISEPYNLSVWDSSVPSGTNRLARGPAEFPVGVLYVTQQLVRCFSAKLLADCGLDIRKRQVFGGIDRSQSISKDFIENIIYPCALKGVCV